MFKKREIRRGDIFWVNFDPAIGTEIQKKRPGVIVSNDAANMDSTRVIVAPITSKMKIIFPFEVRVLINKIEGKILLDQVKSMDKLRIENYIMTVDGVTMRSIDKALKIALSLT